MPAENKPYITILSIETSCDESALSIVRMKGSADDLSYQILGNKLVSQIAIHQEYGGVFPAIAKREHQKALPALLKEVLAEAKEKLRITNDELRIENTELKINKEQRTDELGEILEKEPVLLEAFLKDIIHMDKPDIDAIAVTVGPGLEPALWVGVNFARALSMLWNVSIVPVNHMEGHLLSALITEQRELKVESLKLQVENTRKIAFPALSLLVSGGHTEIILMKKWGDYEKIGQTLDDAVGEAFDKVARMLGLPYPGGPEISKLASQHDTNTRMGTNDTNKIPKLPRPMLHSGDFNFSFSGLKTAVLYLIRDLGGIHKLTADQIIEIAYEFQEAAFEVLVTKTKKAIDEYGIQTLLVGGGVANSTLLQEKLKKFEAQFDPLRVYLPRRDFSTDNSLMIALAGYFNFLDNPAKYGVNKKGTLINYVRANGNLSL